MLSLREALSMIATEVCFLGKIALSVRQSIIITACLFINTTVTVLLVPLSHTGTGADVEETLWEHSEVVQWRWRDGTGTVHKRSSKFWGYNILEIHYASTACVFSNECLFLFCQKYRLPTVTAVCIPEGVESPGRLNAYCMEKWVK